MKRDAFFITSRYYDPQTNSFISKDAYRGTELYPASFNLYTYCENNPLKYIDKDANNKKDILKGLVDALDDDLVFGIGQKVYEGELNYSIRQKAFLQRITRSHVIRNIKLQIMRIIT